MKINLGDEVKCKITGLQGIVTMTAQCLTGCDRVLVSPRATEGKAVDSFWIDHGVVEMIEAGKVQANTVQSAKAGGPMERYK